MRDVTFMRVDLSCRHARLSCTAGPRSSMSSQGSSMSSQQGPTTAGGRYRVRPKRHSVVVARGEFECHFGVRITNLYLLPTWLGDDVVSKFQ